MANRELYQGLCLISTNGYQWMGIYDHMPKEIRDRLKYHSHNLCPACIEGELVNATYAQNSYAWHIAIDSIERKLTIASQ